MSQSQVTNAQGKVTFNLPQENYKVRADYLSGQYFSTIFNWFNVEIDIDHGLVNLHVTFNGEDVFDAPVYLFTESGSYLGRYERTDTQGNAVFCIPSRSYKFRVDYEGTQYWSNVIHVIAHEETDVELALEQLALNLTNDPHPVRFDGKPPVCKPEEIKLASIGSLVGILSQAAVANTSSPKVYYYLNNYLGTPQIMTNENGVVVWEALYQPFGEAEVNPYSNAVNNFRLPGQYYDEEIGLHYNYFRDYHPGIGRYVEPDPVGQIGGVNLFTYVENNPINNTDPEGLFAWGPALRWVGKQIVKQGAKLFGKKIGDHGIAYPMAYQQMDVDSDGDGINDYHDLDSDWDGDGIPNYHDPDDDNDGIPDDTDCENNNVPKADDTTSSCE